MTDLSTQINEQLQHEPGCRGGGFTWETEESKDDPGTFRVTADCHGCGASIFDVPMHVPTS